MLAHLLCDTRFAMAEYAQRSRIVRKIDVITATGTAECSKNYFHAFGILNNAGRRSRILSEVGRHSCLFRFDLFVFVLAFRFVLSNNLFVIYEKGKTNEEN